MDRAPAHTIFVETLQVVQQEVFLTDGRLLGQLGGRDIHAGTCTFVFLAPAGIKTYYLRLDWGVSRPGAGSGWRPGVKRRIRRNHKEKRFTLS
jgi:hypothetical protein